MSFEARDTRAMNLFFGLRGWLRLWVTIVALLVPACALCKPAQTDPGCPSGIPVQDFYVGVSGDVTNSGRTKEGPVCVRVHYNRLRFNLSLNFVTTQGKGVDLSSVLLTGSLPAAAPGGAVDPRIAQLGNILAALTLVDRNASTVNDGVQDIKSLVASIDASIAAGSALPEGAVKQKYKALAPTLVLAAGMQVQALPTDLTSGVCPSSPGVPAAGSVLQTLQGYKADNDFYTANQANVDRALNLANLYKCGGTGQTALTTNIAILKFWDSRFQELGLKTDITDAQLAQLNLSDYFVASSVVACGNIFNQSSSTTASITVYDESRLCLAIWGPPALTKIRTFSHSPAQARLLCPQESNSAPFLPASLPSSRVRGEPTIHQSTPLGILRIPPFIRYQLQSFTCGCGNHAIRGTHFTPAQGPPAIYRDKIQEVLRQSFLWGVVFRSFAPCSYPQACT